MIDVSYARVMADYNSWMNDRLYSVCAMLSDSERKEDRGAFFGSIHRTLNHIMYGDLAFMSRFTGDRATVPELGVDLHDDYDDLRSARAVLDQRIVEWSSRLSDDWLRQKLTYTSKVDGVTRTVSHWILVAHMFNHETHHRGQVTALLSQVGLDVGSTDLPFMPQFQS